MKHLKNNHVESNVAAAIVFAAVILILTHLAIVNYLTW